MNVVPVYQGCHEVRATQRVFHYVCMSVLVCSVVCVLFCSKVQQPTSYLLKMHNYQLADKLVGCVAQWAERRSLAGKLTLSCARPAADG